MMDNALVLFVLVLLPLNLWVTRQLSRPDAEPGAGAIVMSLGIFGLAVLPHLPLPLAVTTRLVAAEAFIIWGILAVSYAVAWRTPAFKIQLAVPANRFAVGTWVAGTSMLTQLLAKSFPLWRSVAVGLTLITVLLWVWSMALALGAFRTVAAAHGRIRTTGLILLTTVATQSVVLLLHDLFPLQTPLSLSFGLIMAGYALYAAGLAFIIAWHCLQKPRWHHLQDWDPTYCIGHGALSITGLAGALTTTVSDTLIALTWLASAVAFIFVESLDLAYLYRRVSALGWRRGVIDYRVAQWARVFTFGMFYAFTVTLQTQVAAHGVLTQGLGPLMTIVARYGQYVVAAVLLFEVAVFLFGNRHATRC